METGDEARRGCQPVSLESVWGECGRSLGHLSTAHLLTCSPAHAQLDADTYSTCRCGRGKRGGIEGREQRARRGAVQCSAVQCGAARSGTKKAVRQKSNAQSKSRRPSPLLHPIPGDPFRFNSIQFALPPCPSHPHPLCLSVSRLGVCLSTRLLTRPFLCSADSLSCRIPSHLTAPCHHLLSIPHPHCTLLYRSNSFRLTDKPRARARARARHVL